MTFFTVCTAKSRIFAVSCSRLIFKAWFQASAAVQMRSALFWVVTQCRLVASFRHFGGRNVGNQL